MLRFQSRAAFALVLAGAVMNGCSNTDDEALALDSSGRTGSAALALEVAPGIKVNTITAILKFPSGKTQEHTINVEPSGTTPTIYFRLPVAQGYGVQLKAQAKETSSSDTMECTSESIAFNIAANAETAVAVPVVCDAPGAIATSVTGTAKVTGSFTVSHATCDSLISKIVIAPATITDPTIPVSVEAYARPKSKAGIELTASKGTVEDEEWNQWTFTCGSAAGPVVFTFTAEADDCTETGSVLFTCPGGPTISCGDGVITAPEVCDTNGTNPDVLPPGTASGSTCNQTCTVIVPPPATATCGDGVITAPELCDTNGANPDVLPPSTPAGSTCNATCTTVIPGPVCGNGAIEAPEVCDTNGAAADVLPSGSAAARTCNATCTAVVPPATATSGECQRTCVEDLATNGACNGLFSPVGADSDPVLDCILGATWPAPNRFPAGSCANGNLLSCYCGPLAPAACLTALPADLTGACKTQVLAGTGCDTRPPAEQSQCVGQTFVNPANATGRAMAYIQCLQDNCPEICFAPAP